MIIYALRRRVVPTTGGRRSTFKSSGPAWTHKVHWVDHSGMYADAMTKKNGNVPLLQMLLRTGRICITEESITLEKHKSNPSVISGVVLINTCWLWAHVLVWNLQNKVVCKRPPCQQISKPKEVPGSCQQLCAHIGSVGFVYLQHLTCVPSS